MHRNVSVCMLALRDTDLISKTSPLLIWRLDICSLGVGIAFIARLRGGAPHTALSHTHRDLRHRDREARKERERRRRSGQTDEIRQMRQKKRQNRVQKTQKPKCTKEKEAEIKKKEEKKKNRDGKSAQVTSKNAK